MDIVLFGNTDTKKVHTVEVDTDIPRPSDWYDMRCERPLDLLEKVGVRGILQACYMVHFHTYTEDINVCGPTDLPVTRHPSPEYHVLSRIEPFPDDELAVNVTLETPFVCQSKQLSKKLLPIFKDD